MRTDHAPHDQCNDPRLGALCSLTARTFPIAHSALLKRATEQPLAHIDCATTVLRTIERLQPCKRWLLLRLWCPGAESNHRHEDFQSTALPTELPGRKRGVQLEGRVLNPRTLHASSNAGPCVRPVSAGLGLLLGCYQWPAPPTGGPRPAVHRSQATIPA